MDHRGASFLLCLAGLPLACGGSVAHDAAADSGTPGPQQVVAGFYATEEAAPGFAPQDSLEMVLGPVPAETSGPCPGAVAVAGVCCAYPPIPPHPTPLPGDGGAAQGAGPDVGTIAFGDSTSGNPIGQYAYTNGTYYPPPAYPGLVWQPGDTLTVSATGGPSIGAFTLSLPALIPPSPTVPATIGPSQDADFTWAPDPNADTMSISVGDGTGAEVVCSVPDAQGSLTIEGSLLSGLQNACQGVAERAVRGYAQTPEGRVLFSTSGWGDFRCTFE